jgi:hypothetical protein
MPLFVYGSLMDSAIRKAVMGCEAEVERGTTLGTWVQLDYPAAIFSVGGARIDGLLLREADQWDECLRRADRYEGVPAFFYRTGITVETSRRTLAAEAYEWAGNPRRRTWPQYCYAVRRRVQIAEMHLAKLERVLFAVQPTSYPAPSVAVQAHFEGILFAFIAAGDKVAHAVNSGWKLGIGYVSLAAVIRNQAWDCPTKTCLHEWHADPLHEDVRLIRNLAMHSHYEKDGRHLTFKVQRHGRNSYAESRELGTYATSVVGHLQNLERILAALEAELRLRNPDYGRGGT